ncbi:MAG: glucose-1-phosphate cytidylyltransferase [Ignavibacteriaceae bacterium]
MKVVILAGGYGSRLSEETVLKPKPIVEIGDKPILWHIMKIYAHYGYCDFVILLGYKGYLIKEYFTNYILHMSDVTIDFKENKTTYFNDNSENWRITLIDTGLDTLTGGRILRARDYIGKERFMLTYGDGVSNIDLNKLLDFHIKNGKMVTLTAVMPEGRYGALELDNQNRIMKFKEKPRGDGAWINGGFFVCEPDVIDYIKDGDSTVFEKEPLEELSKNGEIFAYKHSGFWQSMDTMRDKNLLNDLWVRGKAPWKIW